MDVSLTSLISSIHSPVSHSYTRPRPRIQALPQAPARASLRQRRLRLHPVLLRAHLRQRHRLLPRVPLPAAHQPRCRRLLQVPNQACDRARFLAPLHQRWIATSRRLPIAKANRPASRLTAGDGTPRLEIHFLIRVLFSHASFMPGHRTASCPRQKVERLATSRFPRTDLKSVRRRSCPLLTFIMGKRNTRR